MGRVNRAVSAAVRPLGFRGSKGSWYRVAPEGIADIGTTRRSDPDGVSYGTLFVSVGIAAVPVAWWEYVNLMGMSAEEMQVPLPALEDVSDAGAMHIRLRELAAADQMDIASGRLRLEGGEARLEAVAFLPGASTDAAEELLLRAAGCEAKRMGAA